MTIVKQSQLNHKETISSASSASSSTTSCSFKTLRKSNAQETLNSSSKSLNRKNLAASGEHQTTNSTKATATSFSSSKNTSANLNSNHSNFKTIRGRSKRCLLCYKLLRNAQGKMLNRGHSLVNNHLNSRNVNLVNQSSNTSIRLGELLGESKNGLLLMNYLENGNTYSCDDCYTHLKQIDYHMSELDNLRNSLETKMNKTCKVMRNSSVNGHNNKLGHIRKIIKANRLQYHIKKNSNKNMNGNIRKGCRRAEASIELINKKKEIERLKLLGNSQQNYHHQRSQIPRQHDEEMDNLKIKKQKTDECMANIPTELGIQDQHSNVNETIQSSLPLLSKEQWTELFEKHPEITKRLSNPLLYTLPNDSASTLFAVIAALNAANVASTNKPFNSNEENDLTNSMLIGHINDLNNEQVNNNPISFENPQPSRSKRKPANPSRLFKNENGNNQQEGADGVGSKDNQVENYNIASFQSEKENKRNFFNNNNNNNNGNKRNHSQDLAQHSTKAKSEKFHISSRNENRFGVDVQLQSKSNRNEQHNRQSNHLNKENESCTDGDELVTEHDELDHEQVLENQIDNDEDEGDYGSYGNNQMNGDIDISAEYDEDEQDNENEEEGNEEQEHAYEDEDEYDDENPSAHEPTTEEDELTHKAYQAFKVNGLQYNKQHPKGSSFNRKQARKKDGFKSSKINSTINSDEENEGFDDFEDTNSMNNQSFRKGNKVFGNHKINGNSSPTSSSTKHPCTQCKKTFKTQNILRQHMRIHTGDKPFVCEICHKAFSQMASLKYHSATHSDDRPFKCSNCPKTFKLKPPFKKHVKECQPKSNNQVSSTSSSFNYSSIKV